MCVWRVTGLKDHAFCKTEKKKCEEGQSDHGKEDMSKQQRRSRQGGKSWRGLSSTPVMPLKWQRKAAFTLMSSLDLCYSQKDQGGSTKAVPGEHIESKEAPPSPSIKKHIQWSCPLLPPQTANRRQSRPKHLRSATTGEAHLGISGQERPSVWVVCDL